jgi:hypothetical protein
MATTLHRFIFLVFYCLGGGYPVHGQPVDYRDSPVRQKVVAVSESFLHVREQTGRNDHADIKLFWSLINPAYYQSHPPYCAAFVYYCFRQAGLKPMVPTPALAASWYKKNLVVWEYNPHGNTRRTTEPPKAGLVLYRFQRGGSYRIGHIGILAQERRLDTDDFIVIEANTSGSGAMGLLTESDREGNGIYKKRRSPKSIYAIVDWIPVTAK